MHHTYTGAFASECTGRGNEKNNKKSKLLDVIKKKNYEGQL